MVLESVKAPSKMLKRLLFILPYLVLGFPLKADIGIWDIIAFSLEDKTYYAKVFSHGRLINNDFCYYEYSGEYIKEVSEVFHNYLNTYEPEFFQDVEFIHLGFTGYQEGADSLLFMLKNQIKLDIEQVKNNYNLLYAINGNTYGYTYTPDLKKEDNAWLRANTMDTLFTFTDGGLCNMTLYGIKGKTTKDDLEKMKLNIHELTTHHQSLDPYLSELYRKKIIMIGFCSC